MVAILLSLVLWAGPAKVAFAPGVVSSRAGADAPAFSPDGRLVVFDSPATLAASRLMISRQVDGRWSAPELAPFSGHWYDQDPAMSPDGTYLIFVSNRPPPGGKALGARGGNLWRVDRRGDAWGTPQWLGPVVNASAQIYAPSVAADGSIYFTKDGQSFVCATRGGRYLAARRITVPGFDGVGDPVIAPDGSFLVFDAVRRGRGDLFVAFRTPSGWSPAVDLGTSDDGDSNWDPHLGPGGRLYFSSLRNGVTGIWSIDLAPFLARRSR